MSARPAPRAGGRRQTPAGRFEPTAAGEGVRLVSPGGRREPAQASGQGSATVRRLEPARAQAARAAAKPAALGHAVAKPAAARRVAPEALRDKLPGGRLISDKDDEPVRESAGRIEPELSAPVASEAVTADLGDLTPSVGGVEDRFDAGPKPVDPKAEPEARRGVGALWRRSERRSDALADRLAEARRTLAQEQQVQERQVQETQAEEARATGAEARTGSPEEDPSALAMETEAGRQAEVVRLREDEAERARAEAERVLEARARRAAELERRNKIMQATDAIMARAKAQGRTIEPKDAFMMARRELAQSLRDTTAPASETPAEDAEGG